MESKDRIKIGQRIRELRKEKKITLEELSKGICSVGTMSNIENGLTNIREDTLRSFAIKLDKKISDFYPEVPNEEKGILNIIETIGHMIAYDRGEDAIKKIELLREDNKSILQKNPALMVQLLYAEAMAFKSLKDELQLTICLTKILDYPIANQTVIQIRSKTYHNLAEIYSNKKNYKEAIKNFQAAMNELQSYNLEIPWKINYNLSVLHLYQYDYDQAIYFLTQVKQKNLRFDYVHALLKILTTDFDKGMDELDVIRKTLLETKDYNFLVKVSIASMYFASFSHSYYSQRLETNEYFIKHELSYIQFQNIEEVKLMILKIQLHISNYINYHDLKSASNFLNILYSFEEKYDFVEYRHITLLLDVFIKKNNNLPTSEYELKLLEAKELMDTKGLNNLHYMIVLSELALIHDNPESYSYKLIQQIRLYPKFETLDLIHFENFFPTILPVN